MGIAELVSKRGTCPRRQVGTVIVSKDRRILSTGYNGSPRGHPHCTSVGCYEDELGRCIRAVHSELNAILNAAKSGVGLEGTYLYCTDRPCINCTFAVLQSGIQGVFWLREDTESPQHKVVKDLLRKGGVQTSLVVL